MVGVVVSVVIVFAAGLLAYTLSRHSVTPTARDRHGHGTNADVPVSEVVIRNRAATWIAGQVSRAATMSCDPVMCRILKSRGIPARRLSELTPRTADSLRSDVIVATAAVRSQFGRRLSSIYAPAVIASFGSGTLRIDIRAIAPHGAAAYRSALKADLRARKASGAQLLNSKRVEVSVTARMQLSAGLVDSRLLITIAGMAAWHPVYVVAFGDSGPGAGAGSPLRSAALSEPTDAPGRASPAYVRSLVAFLRSQRAPYRAVRTEQARLADGQPVLRIEFAAPSPLGLLSPNAL